MIAIKAVVKDGMIKPLESIDLSEDGEIVIFISRRKKKKKTVFSFLRLLTSGMTHEKI
jgi:predicted DNA-binding antitoxin AbrB/MazE fold protein